TGPGPLDLARGRQPAAVAARVRDPVPARGPGPRPGAEPVDGGRRRADLLPRRPGSGARVAHGEDSLNPEPVLVRHRIHDQPARRGAGALSCSVTRSITGTPGRAGTSGSLGLLAADTVAQVQHAVALDHRVRVLEQVLGTGRTEVPLA